MTPTPTARRSPTRDRPLRLAVFVSPHGFGHAARTSALLDALQRSTLELDSTLEVTLFTSIPRWFFEESLDFPFAYRELVCDVGMAQRSALEEDLPATVERLQRFWGEAKEAKGFHRGEIRDELGAAGVAAVLCDISPLGLLAARDAGLPSVLVENFTWDWIYQPLVASEPRFAPWVERMRELFALADLRIQAEPVCEPLTTSPPRPQARQAWLSSFPSMEAFPSLASSSSSLPLTKVVPPWTLSPTAELVRVPPIARRPRASVAKVRDRLGLAPAESGRPMILVSMGGIPWSFENLERWRAAERCDFVVPGGAERERREGNLVLLPHHSPVYHPDLVAAADVVVGKLGYSTVAEVTTTGGRMLYLPRFGFREHAVLADFVRRRLPSDECCAEELASGAWLERLPELLARPRPAALASSGADAAARAVVAWLTARGRPVGRSSELRRR